MHAILLSRWLFSTCGRAASKGSSQCRKACEQVRCACSDAGPSYSPSRLIGLLIDLLIDIDGPVATACVWAGRSGAFECRSVPWHGFDSRTPGATLLLRRSRCSLAPLRRSRGNTPTGFDRHELPQGMRSGIRQPVEQARAARAAVPHHRGLHQPQRPMAWRCDSVIGQVCNTPVCPQWAGCWRSPSPVVGVNCVTA